MKYLTAQQKIQQLDKLASQLNKVNLISLASLADVATTTTNALNQLLSYSYESFNAADASDPAYKLIFNYMEQLKRLLPAINKDNIKVMLPTVVEIVQYFKNNLNFQSDQTFVDKIYTTLQSLLTQTQSATIDDPYSEYEEESAVQPLLSQVRSIIEDPSANLVKDLQEQLVKLDPNNAMFNQVNTTGILDNNTTKAIQTVLNTLKKTRNITPAVNLKDPTTFPKLTNLLAVYDEQGVKLY
jgi:hypothetical protein